jgi:sterol desaturase/sphingolipid hydroxylase (fatty acid hydroxylase superfamily)
MGRVIVLSVVAQLSLELVIPYRADWRVSGDRDVWRDIGHLVLYVQAGGIAAQLLLLSGLASILAPLRLPVWPIHSPVLGQVLLVIVAGDGLEYWLHRLSHTVPLF